MAARSNDDDDMERINQETGANITLRHSYGQDVDKVMSDRLDNNEKETKFFNMKNFQKDKHIDFMSNKKEGKAEKNPNDVKEFKVKKTERDEIARIRFLFFNGKSETSHFHPDSTLEEVYRFAEHQLLNGMAKASLSCSSPCLALDAMPLDKTLRQAGLVPAATIMVVPASQPQAESSIWISSKAVILVMLFACLLAAICQSTAPRLPDYQNLKLTTNIAGNIWDLCGGLVGKVGCFVHGLGGLYYICGYIMICCVIQSMYVGLPYGRLVWVGGYDHN